MLGLMDVRCTMPLEALNNARGWRKDHRQSKRQGWGRGSQNIEQLRTDGCCRVEHVSNTQAVEALLSPSQKHFDEAAARASAHGTALPHLH